MGTLDPSVFSYACGACSDCLGCENWGAIRRRSADVTPYTLSLQQDIVKPMDKSIHTDFWLVEVPVDLDILKDHLKHIEEQAEQWRQSAEDILDTMLEKLPTLSQNDRRPWSQFSYDIHDDYVKSRPQYILYNPFLVSLYAVYESAVTQIASLIQEKNGQQVPLDDNKKGDFLGYAKKYYRDVLKLELFKNNQSWERLKILAELRHAIAHANGHLEMVKESKRKKIRNWMDKDIGIEEYCGDIIVTQSFVRETFDTVKDNLEDLLKRYNELDRATRTPL